MKSVVDSESTEVCSLELVSECHSFVSHGKMVSLSEYARVDVSTRPVEFCVSPDDRACGLDEVE